MTKTIALALVLASTASFASANSYFGLQSAQDRGFDVRLDLVSTDVPATIEIYEAGSGDLIGTEQVGAGAHTDLRVALDSQPVGNLNAVLVAGGQVLDTQVIRIDS